LHSPAARALMDEPE